jgi:16S rRNA (guanine527-N7)-methyltransferase
MGAGLHSAAQSLLAERLNQGAGQLGLALTAQQQQRLLQFLALLARWNQVYNLTAVRDPLEMVARHLLDSFSIQPFLFGDRLLDIGTGAGLPGLPLAILEPERRFFLLDSNGKKIRFVRQAVRELGLLNVEPIQARIERYRPGQKFSTIVSRAVTDTEILPVLEAGLLARPGRLLLMKGRHPDDALDSRAWPTLTTTVHCLHVPFLDVSRHLIEIRSV